MDRDELCDHLLTLDDGEHRIIKRGQEFSVENSDPFRTYIKALEARISEAGGRPALLFLTIYAVGVWALNSELTDPYDSLHFLRGWGAGILLLVGVFTLLCIVGNILDRMAAKRYVEEFKEKLHAADTDSDQLIASSWFKDEAPTVRRLVVEGRLGERA